jgi:hypothetical protein
MKIGIKIAINIRLPSLEILIEGKYWVIYPYLSAIFDTIVCCCEEFDEDLLFIFADFSRIFRPDILGVDDAIF